MHQRNIYTNQVHEFCNLEMATNGLAYIKVIGNKKNFDATKMANEYIFQHALEDTNQFENVLETVVQWWDRSIFKTKYLC